MKVVQERLIPFTAAVSIEAASKEIVSFLKKGNILHVNLIEKDYITLGGKGLCFSDSQLIKAARTDKEGRFIDALIIGAYIEARSCERFAKVAPYLDSELQKFYNGLLESEKRHFTIYLHFAEKYSSTDIGKDIKRIGEIEKDLILSSDSEFRFHSGI